MILIFRELRARVGDEERVLNALRGLATAMIRNGRAEAVLLCQRADVLQQLLWMQHHVGHSVRAIASVEPLPLVDSDMVAPDRQPVRVEFVDGAYQFPLPLCHVWVAETSDETVARRLLKVSRLAASDRRICGVSVYRTVEDRSRMMAF